MAKITYVAMFCDGARITRTTRSPRIYTHAWRVVWRVRTTGELIEKHGFSTSAAQCADNRLIKNSFFRKHPNDYALVFDTPAVRTEAAS